MQGTTRNCIYITVVGPKMADVASSSADRGRLALAISTMKHLLTPGYQQSRVSLRSLTTIIRNLDQQLTCQKTLQAACLADVDIIIQYRSSESLVIINESKQIVPVPFTFDQVFDSPLRFPPCREISKCYRVPNSVLASAHFLGCGLRVSRVRSCSPRPMGQW